MTGERILVVDDEKLIRQYLEALLTEEGFDVILADTAAAAREAAMQHAPDAAILDLRLPDGDGMTLLKEFLEADPDMATLMLSAHGDIETAVEAVKLGAYTFLEKPPKTEVLLTTLAHALEARSLKRTVSGLRRQAGWQLSGITIIGRSPAMRDVVDFIAKVATSDSSTVLILGESGVGKEVVAQAIHAHGTRAKFPFLEINCTALPESLLESELFGHEKGAFTDAHQRKQGLLELADRGTVLLDEIGDLPPGAQAKLLRFLETRTFKRVGGIRDISVDVRIIAATNRDLDQAVQDRSFRPDLFYRLNVIPLAISPLRDRPEDIEPLAQHFLNHFSTSLRRPPRTISRTAVAVLERYGWPGNVREVRNVMERITILEEEPEIKPEHLPDELRPGARVADLGLGVQLPAAGVDLEELEKDLLRQALERTRGNRTRAAQLLSLSRDTLRYRIEKYHMSDVGGTRNPR